MQVIQDLGFDQFFLSQVNDWEQEVPLIGRVVEVQRGLSQVLGGFGLVSAIASKNLHHITVGDFVGLKEQPKDGERGVIVSIFDRKSLLQRKSVGEGSGHQGIASNIDYVFIVSSANEEFNLSRLERYLLAARSSGAIPILIISKKDLCVNIEDFISQLKSIASSVDIISISALTGDGFNLLEPYLQRGKTLVLVGSSGVGKSTIVNALKGDMQQQTQEISFDAKGRHTTSHRELFILESGALLIDTPGMKEFAPMVSEHDIKEEFSDIEDLSRGCKFRNCGHTDEPGCQVLAAIESDKRLQRRLDNFRKLHRERMRLESREFRDNEKRRWKTVTKEYRKFKKLNDH